MLRHVPQDVEACAKACATGCTHVRQSLMGCGGTRRKSCRRRAARGIAACSRARRLPCAALPKLRFSTHTLTARAAACVYIKARAATRGVRVGRVCGVERRACCKRRMTRVGACVAAVARGVGLHSGAVGCPSARVAFPRAGWWPPGVHLGVGTLCPCLCSCLRSWGQRPSMQPVLVLRLTRKRACSSKGAAFAAQIMRTRRKGRGVVYVSPRCFAHPGP